MAKTSEFTYDMTLDKAGKKAADRFATDEKNAVVKNVYVDKATVAGAKSITLTIKVNR